MFDNVIHNKLIEILKEIGIKGNDLAILTNLYWKQTSSIPVKRKESEDVEIQRVVRQGHMLSTLLFNIYAKRVFEETTGDIDIEIKINGENINIVRYTHDTEVLAESQ